GEWRQIHAHARKIDVAARAKCAGREHAALHAIGAFLQHFHPDHAVIDQHDVADIDVVYEPFVIYVHRIFLFALRPAHGELDYVARFQLQIGLYLARANGRTLRVEQDGDG